MRLGKIMIFVSNLDEAKRFYCGALNFPLKFETETRLEFVHEGCDFVAFKCEKDVPVKDYGNVARSVFVFEVSSVETAMAEMGEAGVIFLHVEPADNDFCRYAAFSDPFGNVHEIFEAKL